MVEELIDFPTSETWAQYPVSYYIGVLQDDIRELKGEIERLWDEIGKARQRHEPSPLIDLQKDYIKLPDGRWVRKDQPEIRAWMKMVDREKGVIPKAKKKEYTGIDE